MKHAPTIETKLRSNPAEQYILDEIEQLSRGLEARVAVPRPAPSCVVRAYHVLLDRQYQQLDRLDKTGT